MDNCTTCGDPIDPNNVCIWRPATREAFHPGCEPKAAKDCECCGDGCDCGCIEGCPAHGAN